MNVNEVLQFVDQLLIEKTGKHLDDIQKAVVEGTWERQTYDDIAKKCHITEGYVGDVGSELWKLLSEALGENIKKSNFRSVFERLNIESCDNTNFYINGINNGFYYLENSQHQDKNNTKKYSKTQSYYHDLILAPKIINFHNRESELQTLSNWIFNQNTPLISILGLSGIGKSYLVRRFIDLNLDQFEVIIWKPLKYPKPLNLLINDLLNTCEQEPKETIDDKLKQLFDIFTDKKCLIILDDVQNIFITGQFAGQYQTEYKDYQKLFTMITEIEHQSHIILISQEQCPEMECLDEELYPIRCLELSGLNNTDILKNTGLQDEESWLNLIKLYEGNLMYLKNITMLINKNYDGKVADFLAENTLHITNQMQSHFSEIFNHLSPQEQEILLQLSKFEKPISREELRQSLNLSSVDFNNGLQSLQQRYLVTKIKEEKILFKLSPVFREYVRNYCKD
ncbi:MAG: ATP-binding protein [Aphanizomenon gracile PMC638.10]|nr:ATP-binding protein [Aphanizomenon gracile PMC638.10]